MIKQNINFYIKQQHGNSNTQYPIRKRYTENLQSWEIWKQCEGSCLNSKSTKNKINDSKDIKGIRNIRYLKTKNQTATMVKKDF